MKETLEIWHLVVGFAIIIIMAVYKFSANSTKTDAEIKELKKEVSYLKESNKKRVIEITELERDVKNELQKIGEIMNRILIQIELINERTTKRKNENV
jgi:heme/copper-type cytochrome/quinol oxidase subunit 2